jgi:hypothetical protein
MELMPGDVGLTASTTWLGRSIRRWQGVDEAKVNHVFIVVSRDPGAWSTEALWRVRSGDVRGFYAAPRSKDLVAVYRLKGLTDEDRRSIAREVSRYSARSYGVGKIVLHAIDHVLSRLSGRTVFLARRLARLDRVPICSYLAAKAYDRPFVGLSTGYRFLGLPPEAVQPDDIMDDVENNSAWDCIHELGPLREDE